MEDDLPRPILKWAGGKRRLAPEIERLGLFPETISTYYEPFFGAGAVFFYLWGIGKVKRAVLSDINPEIINLNVQTRDHVEKLIAYMENLDIRSKSQVFYDNRNRFNLLKKIENPTDEELLEKAALMMYLNRTSFSGMYRENKKGEFNVPFGRYKNPTIYSEDNLLLVSRAFKGVKFICGDFMDVMSQCKPTTKSFVYFDPPYMQNEKGEGFISYSKMKFYEADQVRLRDYYLELTNKGIKSMLSNSSSERIFELYSVKNNIRITTIPAIRSINARNGGLEKVDEYLVVNY